MASNPILDAEINPGAKLSSWLLKRLRDNWQEDLCDPPGSQTPKLRPSSYRMKYAERRLNSSVVVSNSTHIAELSDVTALACVFDGYGKSAGTNFSLLKVGTNVRIARTTPLFASEGSLSGTLFTLTQKLIPITNTWSDLWTWSTGGLDPTLEAKAYSSGSATKVEFRWTGSIGSLTTVTYATSQIYTLQNNTPDL